MATYNSNTNHGYTLRATLSPKSPNVASNYTPIDYELYLVATNNWFNDYTTSGNFTIEGHKVWEHNGKMSIPGLNSTTLLSKGTINIPHLDNGTKTVDFSASFYSDYNTYGTGQLNLSGKLTLATIPRYAVIKSLTKSDINPTWFTISWATDVTVESWWYSTNDGTTWSAEMPVNGKSATYRIKGLTPNTEYPLKISVKRKDNGLYTNSNTYKVKTIPLSTVTNLSNFNIDQTLALKINESRNDLIYRVRLKWYNPTSKAWENIYAKDDIVSTSLSVTLDNATKQKLRTNCPNSKTFKARAELSNFDRENAYQGLTTTIEVVGTLTGISPTLGALSWVGKDTSSTVALLGNLGKIIRQKTPFDIKVSSASAGEGATLKKVSATALTETVTTALSGTVQNNISLAFNPTDKWHNLDVIVTVTDSRGMTASKTLKIPIQNWGKSVLLVAEANRENGYEATTQFNVKARYWDISEKNKYFFRYAIKKKSDSDYPKNAEGNYIFTEMSYKKTRRSGTDNDWQHVVSEDFVFPALDTNTEYIIWVQYGESLEDWRNIYIPVGKGIGLLERYQDKYVYGVPIIDKATGSKYITMADLIVEKGSNYTKYADGRLVVEMRKDVSVTCNTAWGSSYYAEVPGFTYPMPFIGELPHLTIGYSANIALSLYKYSSILTGTGTLGFIRPATGQTTTVTITIKAEGKWK